MRTFGLILAAAAVAVNGAGITVRSSAPTRVNGRWPRTHSATLGPLAHTRTPLNPSVSLRQVQAFS